MNPQTGAPRESRRNRGAAVPQQTHAGRPQRPGARLGRQRLIPGATLERTLALVQDYGRHKVVYQPEVIDSRILSHNGNDFHIYLRLLKKKVITVVLASEHDVKYTQLDKTRWRSVSRTTKIAEVEHAGKPDEREKLPGTGEGFLWRLNSYWRFEERDGGTWVECEAISDPRCPYRPGLGHRADHPRSAQRQPGKHARVPPAPRSSRTGLPACPSCYAIPQGRSALPPIPTTRVRTYSDKVGTPALR